jgi:hypothetical protein
MLRKTSITELNLESFKSDLIALAQPLEADSDECAEHDKRFAIALFYNKYHSIIYKLKAAVETEEKYFFYKI